MNEKIMNIKKYGKTAKGRQELIKHLEGGRLTLKQAVNAGATIVAAIMRTGNKIAIFRCVHCTRSWLITKTSRR
jgi:hypothetical protein